MSDNKKEITSEQFIELLRGTNPNKFTLHNELVTNTYKITNAIVKGEITLKTKSSSNFIFINFDFFNNLMFSNIDSNNSISFINCKFLGSLIYRNAIFKNNITI